MTDYIKKVDGDYLIKIDNDKIKLVEQEDDGVVIFRRRIEKE